MNLCRALPFRFATLTGLAVTVSILAAGCSVPDPANGKLACGAQPHPCPGGYVCSGLTNTCWKLGTEPSPDAGADVGRDAPPSRDGLPTDGVLTSDGPGQGSDSLTPSDTVSLPDSVVSPDVISTGRSDTLLSDSDAATSTDVLPVADVFQSSPDAAHQPPDAPRADAPLDGATDCPSTSLNCSGQCVVAGPSACCVAADCAGSCMTCGADHVCTALKGQDDPTGRCAGTCDAAGACKSKQGQACTATSGGCLGGTSCADGYCCDKACTGTCEACDSLGSLGTCKTLAAGAQPRAGRTACTGTDATCAGKCDGSSAACSYATGACGTAACTSSTYQGAGTCNAGACTLPAPKSCPNACVVASGGCTGECAPASASPRCSATGVPQTCNASGAWEDKTACANGFACASGACACAAPKQACGNTCADLSTDANNCSSCGHSCLGGTCAAGACQPLALTGNLVGSPAVFGLDASNVYYQLPSSNAPNASDAYRISKTAVGATGSLVLAGASLDFYEAALVSGSSTVIFIGDAVGKMFDYTVGSSGNTKLPLAESNGGVLFGNFNSSPPRYYTQFSSDVSTTFTFHWYNLSNASVGTHAEATTGIAPSGGIVAFHGYFAAGDSIYWIRDVEDSTFQNTSATGLYTTTLSALASAKTQLAGGADLGTMQIVDVSDRSILLLDNASTLYRVALPGGSSTSLPSSVTINVAHAIEDANGLYFADSTGKLSRCAAANCENTKVQLASGQGTVAGLYQDATALYWGRATPNQIMRLAK